MFLPIKANPNPATSIELEGQLFGVDENVSPEVIKRISATVIVGSWNGPTTVCFDLRDDGSVKMWTTNIDAMGDQATTLFTFPSTDACRFILDQLDANTQ